jgi:hypothetical protein
MGGARPPVTLAAAPRRVRGAGLLDSLPRLPLRVESNGRGIAAAQARPSAAPRRGALRGRRAPAGLPAGSMLSLRVFLFCFVAGSRNTGALAARL